MYRNLRKNKKRLSFIQGWTDCEMMAFIPGGGAKAVLMDAWDSEAA